MAIEDEDLTPRTVRPAPRNLDPMSVDELTAYIAELEGEIARVKGEIEKKRSFRAGAESVFKK